MKEPKTRNRSGSVQKMSECIVVVVVSDTMLSP